MGNKIGNPLYEIDDLEKKVYTRAEIDALFDNIFYKPGDSIVLTKEVQTAGFITSSATNVLCIFPLAKQLGKKVKGASARGMSLILRQNGNYLYGSASSLGSIDDSSVTVTLYSSCLQLTFHIPAPDKAVNNSAAGVSFRGTITFN